MTKANYPNFARVEAHTLTGEERGGDENAEGERGRGKGRRKLSAIKNQIIEKNVKYKITVSGTERQNLQMCEKHQSKQKMKSGTEIKGVNFTLKLDNLTENSVCLLFLPFYHFSFCEMFILPDIFFPQQ